MRYISVSTTLTLVVTITMICLTSETSAFVSPPRALIASQQQQALQVASLDPFDDMVRNHQVLLVENGDNDDPPPNHNNDIDVVSQLPLLLLQFVAVLGIKAVKDLLHYPPLWVQQAVQGQQQAVDSETHAKAAAAEILNPPLLVVKLLLVLVLKSLHDAVYYPTLWAQRWYSCQSLEECPL